jgi:ubiquinone/menaquinone biosynthesis C-methylase UbiE
MIADVFFSRPRQKHALAIAMTGVKLGDRLLHVACTDASMLAAIGSKVGLSGRVCAIVPTETDASRARRAAETAGFLLELETNDLSRLPYEDEAFNLIVIDNQHGMLTVMRPERRVALVKECFRTLAPRGRTVVVERAPRGGLGALLSKSDGSADDPIYRSSGGAIAALEAEGFRAARLLAERDGLSFFEGVR